MLFRVCQGKRKLIFGGALRVDFSILGPDSRDKNLARNKRTGNANILAPHKRIKKIYQTRLFRGGKVVS